jgi:hypothetical protein
MATARALQLVLYSSCSTAQLSTPPSYPISSLRTITIVLSTTSGIRKYVAAWSIPIICCFVAPASLTPIEF